MQAPGFHAWVPTACCWALGGPVLLWGTSGLGVTLRCLGPPSWGGGSAVSSGAKLHMWTAMSDGCL